MPTVISIILLGKSESNLLYELRIHKWRIYYNFHTVWEQGLWDDLLKNKRAIKIKAKPRYFFTMNLCSLSMPLP